MFDSGAYEAVFMASGGIPRRINALCDRLLLSGFLAGKSEITLGDVDAVAKELREETYAPQYFSRDGGATHHAGGVDTRLTDSCILDVDLSRIELASSAADEANRVINDMKSVLSDQRIARIERSMIRIERTSAATLTLLQQLVNAVRTRQSEKENPS